MADPPNADDSENPRPVRTKTPENPDMDDIAKDLDPFDWDDLEHRFVLAMEERTREEQKLTEEAQQLFQVLNTMFASLSYAIYSC